MLLGELIFNNSTSGQEWVYTPPAPRGSASATLAVDVLQVAGSTGPTLTIEVQTRNGIEDS